MITPSKAAALAVLHAKRRGVPVHPEPPPELAELAQLARDGAALASRIRNPASLRKLAKALDVDDKTVARWLRGEDRPARGRHADIRRVTKTIRAEIAALKTKRK